MRPLDQVLDDVAQARNINDAVALMRLAEELDLHQTPMAEATACRSRGTVSFMRGDYAASLTLFQKALSLFESSDDHRGVARTLNSIGLVLYQLSDPSQALEYFNRAYDLSKEICDDEGIPSIVSHLALVYRRLGDYSSALEHFHRSAALCEEIGDRNGIAGAICNIGSTLFDIGDYPGSLDHLHRALVLIVETGNRLFEAVTLLNIGNVHDAVGEYEEALTHYRNALMIYQELGDKGGIAAITTCIGWTYHTMGDLTTAIDYHHRAHTLHKEIGAIEESSNDLCNIILVKLEQDSIDEARTYFTEFDAITIVNPVVHIWREECRARIQLHDGDAVGAESTLRSALGVALEHDLRGKAADVHKQLRDLAQQRNDLAAYIEHNNAYTGIREEINGKNTAAKLAAQEAERRIARERQEHEKQIAVLHSTLPKHIADRVSRGEQVTDHYDNAAVIFVDIVGFTTLSSTLSSTDVVNLLDSIFTTLDDVCKRHDVVKIKTIGDSYMAVAFPRFARNDSALPHAVRNDNALPHSVRNDNALPHSVRNDNAHLFSAASAALEMLDVLSPASSPASSPNGSPIEVRIGLHCGPLTAGVIGKERLQYDVWGDTVNVASRMESTGEPGRIHVSETFANALNGEMAKWRNSERANVIPSISEEPFPIPYSLFPRGEIEIKGKGPMTTYWLEQA